MKTGHAPFTVLLFTLTLFGWTGGSVTADDSDDHFSSRTLKGQWGFSAFGTIGPVPAAAIGRLTFDGRGQCVNVATLNFGGALVPLTTNDPNGACSYTVNFDGTGRIEQTFIDPTGTGPFGTQPAIFDVTLIIVDDGKEFRFIVDDPSKATVGNGVAKRQGGDND